MHLLRKIAVSALPKQAERSICSLFVPASYMGCGSGRSQVDDIRRFKTLEAENARLKTLVAEHDLEIEVMKEIAANNGKRAGSPFGCCVCDGPGSVLTVGLHADRGRAIGVGLSIRKARRMHW